MSSSFCVAFVLLGLILTVQSVYQPYLYDDGHGSDEHCCLVRVQENFCLATPITRSLIQVNKQCERSPNMKHRRLRQRNRNNAYMEKISHRLNVQNIHEDEEKIFIELQKPLEKTMLQKDLICLTSTKKNMNFGQCHVQLAEEWSEDYVPNREHRRRKHRGRDEHVGQMKSPVVKSEEEEPEPDEAEKETRRMEISQPVRIREGHGLSFFKQYQINRSRIHPQTRQERRCWSWYRDHIRKIHRKPSKSCISLSNARENCIYQLVSNTFNHTEPMQLSFPIDSKLFCKASDNYDKLLGHYHEGELCFGPNDRVILEYKFSDIAGLSDRFQNRDALEFLGNNEKLTAEFEDDCHGKTNLVEETTSEN